MAPSKQTQARRELTRARVARDTALQSIRKIHELALQADADEQKQPIFMARHTTLERSVDVFMSEQQNVLSSLVELEEHETFTHVDSNVTEEMEQLCGEIQVIFCQLNVVSNVTRNETTEREKMVSARMSTLPKIELPKFDGSLINWCAFRDMFISLVHENRSISDIERFHYLISCLSGSALDIVKMVPLTAFNYEIAWRALLERYDNKRLLATAHFEKIFSFAQAQRESVATLSAFVNTFRENVAAIKALGVNDLAGFLLFYIGARVVDPETRRLFEASIPQDSIPILDQLLDFATQRCKILENVGMEKTEVPVSNGSYRKGKGGQASVKTSLSTTATAKTKCAQCSRDHSLFRCFTFKKMPVTGRRELVANKKLCFVCLSADHLVSACQSTFKCRLCDGRHSTLLHVDAKSTIGNNQDTSKAIEKPLTSVSGTNENNSSSPSFSGTVQSDIRVVLATALVRIKDHTGNYVRIRVLLDSGSQVSAITTECANRIGLPRSKTRTDIVGLSQQPVTTVKGVTSCTLVPAIADVPQFQVNNVIILPKITTFMPNEKLPITVRERYGHLSLADPEFDVPGPIEMLIGSDLYPFILQTRSEIIHSPGLPSAMSTQFGWIIVGTVNDSTNSPMISLSIRTTPAINDLMYQFWAVEEPNDPEKPCTEAEICEKWFSNTVSRDQSGRFHVALPFRNIVQSYSNGSSNREETPCDAQAIGLGSSRSMALNRLFNLERRLSKDPELYHAYREFMREYLSLGHMKPAQRPGEYYIPHHAVVKRDEKGIKIRVVFDASAKTSSGRSLNDCLLTGPKLQADITDILLRNRFHKFIFSADIVKMYRQICVQENDRIFQHILWRESPDAEVQEYELCTITYGMNAAPFLAIRCLRQLDHEEGPEFPLARHLLTTSTYVDDIIAGANTEEDAERLQEQVVEMLKRGGFELKKWASNCPAVLARVPVEDLANYPYFEPTEGLSIKVLGLYWDPRGDTFGYRLDVPEVQSTKRSILSTIARIYDPIGTLGPMIFWAKSLIQQLWCQKLGWDVPTPSCITNKWETFMAELPSVKNVTIHRHINIRHATEVQLIGFADASQKGYAATVYLRVLDQGNIQVHFVTCKSKVAPLKSSLVDHTLTIPRLELCAAVLLSRVLSRTLAVLQDVIHIHRVRAFSDSTIVLAWLRAEPKAFKIFVTNRIEKIKALLPEAEWMHVSSQDNSADPASRGLMPGEMKHCELHLNGPSFLRLPENQWPSAVLPEILWEQLPEGKRNVQNVLHTQETDNSDNFLQRFSSMSRMQRIFAYCKRFIDLCRKKKVTLGSFSHAELEAGLTIAIKITQNVYWNQLQKQLTRTSTKVTPNNLAHLSPFLDSEGIIRVGGRLRLSSLPEDTKHPVLLPKMAHLTKLIIWHTHICLLHAGPKLVMSMIQRKFWIVSGRSIIRKIIHSCIPCTRYRAVCPQPRMADLPEARVQVNRPFAFVGMDYGGPFMVKNSRHRNSKTSKAYLALFICMSTKAVHLEVVSDLSSETFLAAFDRFIARRGIPTEIHSDCGTNYVGAARQLKALFHEAELQNRLQSRIPCRWKFNPPAAPHFGGLWEAAIKSAKTHLRKVIGTQILTMEELWTLIIRIEGILNSRPLTAMSTDPTDLSALTPGHFLIGQPIMALPETDLTLTPVNRLRRWQLIQQAHQSFWKRWTREYLHTLQSRQKWYAPSSSLAVGDLVTINTPNSPPMAWQLGRVIEVHPGTDQVVRVATVKTADGVVKRPVVKLVRLPVTP